MDDEMADLTQEVFDSLPDAVKEDYEQQGEVFVPVAALKLAKLKGNLDKAYSERDELKGKMTEAEQKKAEEIEQAAEEKLKKALEEGSHAEATRLLQEKLQDAERRAGESETKFNERMKAVAEDKKNVIVSELALKATSSGKKAFARLMKDYISVDAETGEATYLNDDGSASSLNKEQFFESLKSNDLFKPLIQDALPATPGVSNGNTSFGGTGKPVNTAANVAKDKGDAIGHLNAHFREAFKR